MDIFNGVYREINRISLFFFLKTNFLDKNVLDHLIYLHISLVKKSYFTREQLGYFYQNDDTN